MSRNVPGVRRSSLLKGRGAEGVLASFNETQENRQLHPTKGWRTLNVKRARAQILIDLHRMGASVSSALQAQFLREGHMKNFGGN